MSDNGLTDQAFEPDLLQQEPDLQVAAYNFPVGDDAGKMAPVYEFPAVDFVESKSSTDSDANLDHVMTTKTEIARLIESMPENELGEHVWRVLEETHPSVRDMLEIYMVIDDDNGMGALSTLVLERILGKSPAIVAYFQNSVHAVNFFRTNTHGRIKGIVADYHMPQLNGIDVLQAVRELDHGQDTSFVLMSGGLHNDPDFPRAIRVLEDHGAKYEQKPWGLSELKEALQRSLFEGNAMN